MSYALKVQEEDFLKELSLSDEETIESVTYAMLEQPQSEAGTVHKFGPGIYMRELHAKAGTFAIGKYHKHPHMNIVLQGSCVYYTSEGERREVKAPTSMVTPAGRKIAIFTEDTVWINVYATDEKDVETIEKELFVESEALMDREAEMQSHYEAVVELEREDFLDACTYLGLTPEQVSEASQSTLDLIPFPDGSYSVAVKDSIIHGKGLFATNPIKKGDFIAPGRINGCRTPAGRYTNHSAVPNAEFIMSPNGDVALYATEDIGGNVGGLMGDEILVNYVDAFINTRVEQ